MSPAELASLARESGEQLVADLARAESLSAGWADADVGFALLSRALDRCLARLAATERWGKQNQLPSGELWTAAGTWLDVSWLQHRARFKPRGYAGDFEMFDRFWRRECCQHPLGRIFDRYFQGQAAVEAVRGRTEQIAAAIIERCLASEPRRTFHVASVGCGPAIELALAAQAISGRGNASLRITLLDLDEAALDHARQRLSPWVAAEQVVAVRENLYRLADRPQVADLLKGVDFLCCSGLFDYLADDTAQNMLRLFWERLGPGGMLTAGNFASHNPTRAYMEWIGNWYLLYRTPDDLARLATAAGIPEAGFTVGSERLGIDLFLQAVKE